MRRTERLSTSNIFQFQYKHNQRTSELYETYDLSSPNFHHSGSYHWLTLNTKKQPMEHENEKRLGKLSQIVMLNYCVNWRKLSVYELFSNHISWLHAPNVSTILTTTAFKKPNQPLCSIENIYHPHRYILSGPNIALQEKRHERGRITKI